MRLHENYGSLWPWMSDEVVRDLLRAEYLVAARFEPTLSPRIEGYLDALFEHNGKWLIIPFLRVDGTAVMVPERTPLAWPARLGAFNGPEIDRVDAKLLPWLRSICCARMVTSEATRYFRETPELLASFEKARALQLVGAARYEEVMTNAAPAVYALRLARNGRVALRGPHAASYAAILSKVADAMDVDCGEFEKQWFSGLEFGSINLGAQYACYVGPRESAVEAQYGVYPDSPVKTGERRVQVARSLPVYVTVSFDPQDAPVGQEFAVTECGVLTRSLPFTEPAATSGSAGIIRLVVREDAERFPDADTDAAASLAALLAAEGFDAEVTNPAHLDTSRVDLVHIFGLRHGPAMLRMLQSLDPKKPVVITPHADDRSNQAVTGCSGNLLIPRSSSDVVAFTDYVNAFEKRRLSNLATGVWYDDLSLAIVRRAGSAIVVAPTEDRFLRERFGFTGKTAYAPAIVPLTRPTSEIGSIVGSSEYILLHAPLEPRNNQVYAAIAAKRVGLPLVLLGPVTDTEFYAYINEVCDQQTIQLREELLSEAEIAGLYARARVVADISWSSRGLARLARGAAFGASIVASSLGYVPDVWSGLGVCTVDPGGLDNVVEGFRTAWERQPVGSAKLVSDTAVIADPFSSLVATLSAYQQASAPVAL